jgi:uncharacterized protein
VNKEVFHFTEKGLEVKVFVLPRSSESRVVGIVDEFLKIKLTKPPVDGQANAECCKVVAKYFDVSRSRVKIVQGKTTRRKLLFIDNVSEKKLKHVCGCGA